MENFQQTPAVPDGLAVMAQGYKMLGMDELSENAVQVLAANYPEYPRWIPTVFLILINAWWTTKILSSTKSPWA